jgi:hypothetical protein
MSTCHNNVPSGRKRKTAALRSPILSVMYRPGTHRATFQNCQYVHPPALVSKTNGTAIRSTASAANRTTLIHLMPMVLRKVNLVPGQRVWRIANLQTSR